MKPLGARLRFYAELNDFLPPSQRKQELEVEFHPPVPVRHLIESLGVPHTEVDLILVNGTSRGFEYRVEEGDRISVYPMFEALDITPLLRLREQPLRTPRFLADAHLGGLARYLRLLGFDTTYPKDFDDPLLVELASRESRILLSKDRALLMHRALIRGCYIRATAPLEQLLEVVRRLDLRRLFQPFSRCLECNGVLSAVVKEEIRARLPTRVAEIFDRFWECPGCRRLYWRGSHYDRLSALVGRIEAATACDQS